MKHFGRPRWRRVTLAVFFTFVLAIGFAPSAANGAQVSFCPTEGSFPAESVPGPELQK
jgi:hypothetical protein